LSAVGSPGDPLAGITVRNRPHAYVADAARLYCAQSEDEFKDSLDGQPYPQRLGRFRKAERGIDPVEVGCASRRRGAMLR
jgi:hypothetical protein